jgi:hypothetical protein
MGLLNESKHLKDRAITLARSRYLDALAAKFENSSKKAVRESLHANINGYKSLGTFYQHTKDRERHEYISELFTDHRLSDLFKILRISDGEIQEQNAQAKNHKNDAEILLRGN